MFPNVRLMIVAVLASIVGIGCALGLFAEFRVSHDSVWRESNAGTPLQLGAGGPQATLISAAATFGTRFEAQPSLPVAGAGADIVASPQASDPAVPVPTPAAAPPAPAVPVTAPETATAPQQTNPPAASDTAPVPATSATPAVPASVPADNAPAANLAERTPAASPSPERTAPAQPTPELKAAPRIAPAVAQRKHVAARHRPLIARRTLVRPRAAASVQTFTTAQPGYQWAPPGQTVQPVRRRVIARRPRPVQRPGQAPQAAISGTPVASAPE